MGEDQEGGRQGVKQKRPQSPPLIVDSVSGIYLGFEDNDSCNNKNEIEEVTHDDDDDLKNDDNVKKDVETTSCQTEAQSSNFSWKFLKFKKSSKYCVNSERAEKKSLC